MTQVATRCCGRAKASTKKRIPRLLLWRGVGLRSASDSRSCRPKAATALAGQPPAATWSTKRTLDGEDRSGIVKNEGKRGTSPSRVRCAASRPGRLRADPADVAVHEGKGMSRRPPAQISECARLIRASSSIAGTGLMSVSPPATTRAYSGASPYCLGKASRAPIWFLTRSPGGYPAMSKMTLLRPSSTSASCTNERFRNDPTPNWFSRTWGLRNAIAGEIQLAIVFCNAVREAVIQALRREGTSHHHNPALDGKHN